MSDEPTNSTDHLRHGHPAGDHAPVAEGATLPGHEGPSDDMLDADVANGEGPMDGPDAGDRHGGR